ncbi:hypothetical protein H8D83_01550 [Candidatus Woesearchaeota archaeon]|nr:hypothetical protein [Candidatus Woesearchaeota archaeon]MBL7057365.1 hypothetical protein [Candidatus Woesearchaeota archaeon]
MDFKKFVLTKPEYWILFVLLIVLVVFSILSQGTWGEDDVGHYMFAKMSWNHPRLFLDLWARPGYTILASSFAQFGLLGVELMNAVLCVLTSYMAFLVVKKLKFKRPYLVIILLGLQPLFFFVSLSALTEILGAFLLTLSLWLYLKGKFTWTVVSLLALCSVRIEAILFYILFAIFMVVKKRRSIIPIIILPAIIYVVGIFVFGNLNWLFVYPNSFDTSVALHFRSPVTIFIYLAGMVFAMGVVVIPFFTIGFFRNFKKLLLINISILIMIFFLSIIYWLNSSVNGTLKYVALVSPLIAIVSLGGFNNFFDKRFKRTDFLFLALFIIEFILLYKMISLKLFFHLWHEVAFSVIIFGIIILILIVFKLVLAKNKKLKNSLILLFIILIIIQLFASGKFPINTTSEQRLLIEAHDWLEENNLSQRDWYYAHTYVPYIAHHDPWDVNYDSFVLGGDYFFKREKNFTSGSIVIWEPRMFYFEAKIHKRFFEDNEYEMIKSFEPKIYESVYDGTKLEVLIFERIS